MNNQALVSWVYIYFLCLFQYIFGALRDCLQPMSYVRHLTSPQDLLDSFDKEIYDQTKEVLNLRCMDTPPSFSTMFSGVVGWSEGAG